MTELALAVKAATAARDRIWSMLPAKPVNLLKLPASVGKIPVNVPEHIRRDFGDYDAVNLKINAVRTDAKRFQNRKNAFSEASAANVAEYYDANKFDPVVVWLDPRDGKVYVLSGHSRYEGLKRRGAAQIPVRFFEGEESQAIAFARRDANRVQTPESFTESLVAYKDARDGAPDKGLKRATKTDIKRAFGPKADKMDAYTYLDANGKFITALSEDDRSAYPHIEAKARWVGELKKDYPEITPPQEQEMFIWLYADKNNLDTKREDFEKLVLDRLRLGKERIFPECDENFNCAKSPDIEMLLKSRRERELYADLRRADAAVARINYRFNTNDLVERIHTKVERNIFRDLLKQQLEEKARLQKELGIAEKVAKEPTFFGLRGKRKNPLLYARCR
jgi:hypothetical protein